MNPNMMRDSLAAIATTVHLADGRELHVNVRNPSLAAWDITRADKGWPKADDAPSLWMTYICWDALCRQGDYPRADGKTSTFPHFRDVDCAMIDDPEDVDADPTRTAVEQDSPSLSASEPDSPGESSSS